MVYLVPTSTLDWDGSCGGCDESSPCGVGSQASFILDSGCEMVLVGPNTYSTFEIQYGGYDTLKLSSTGHISMEGQTLGLSAANGSLEVSDLDVSVPYINLRSESTLIENSNIVMLASDVTIVVRMNMSSTVPGSILVRSSVFNCTTVGNINGFIKLDGPYLIHNNQLIARSPTTSFENVTIDIPLSWMLSQYSTTTNVIFRNSSFNGLGVSIQPIIASVSFLQSKSEFEPGIAGQQLFYGAPSELLIEDSEVSAAKIVLLEEVLTDWPYIPTATTVSCLPLETHIHYSLTSLMLITRHSPS